MKFSLLTTNSSSHKIHGL